MKYLILLTLAFAAPAAWAAEEAPRLPPTAQAILDTAERAIAVNRAKYDDANKKPLADAEKALKAEQDKLGKAGKLEEALAIKKTLESFRDELVAKVDEKAMENGDLLGDNKPKYISVQHRLIGNWTMWTEKGWHGTCTIDGKLNYTRMDGVKAKVEIDKNGVITIQQSHGYTIKSMTWDEKEQVYSGDELLPNGTPLTKMFMKKPAE